MTKNGIIKKSSLDEYNLKRGNGAIALKLDKDDEIVSVLFVDEEKIGIASKAGQFILIHTDSITPIGRVARGVIGMKLNDGDEVVGARAINSKDKEIVSISEDGYIKRSSVNELTLTSRATKGKKLQRTDALCDFIFSENQNDLLVVASGSQIRLNYMDVPSNSLGTQGVRAIKLSTDSKVIKLSQF